MAEVAISTTGGATTGGSTRSLIDDYMELARSFMDFELALCLRFDLPFELTSTNDLLASLDRLIGLAGWTPELARMLGVDIPSSEGVDEEASI